ncbi:MAG: DUF1854 domain-containing protein [Planctomycetales bacterium]|nr:DUF1854 domain-containing protein [Planctomycetales bacterium]
MSQPNSDFAPHIQLERDHWGRLVFEDQSGRHENVSVQAIFPLSDPDHWIAITNAAGRELALFEDPGSLAPAARQMLRDELRRRTFVPEILRIVRFSGHTTPCEWQIETDRGPTRIVLKSDDDVRRLSGDRILIHDAQRNRYLIPNLAALDAKTRRIVEWYV